MSSSFLVMAIHENQFEGMPAIVDCKNRSRVWPRENGTVCPFGVFPMFCSNILPNLRPVPVMSPVVSLRFPLSYRHFSWVFPNSALVLFDPRNGPLQKHHILKGKYPILARKIL